METVETLRPSELRGSVERESGSPPVDGATWYEASDVEDALVYEVEASVLADADYLVADLLLDGTHLAKFQLRLREGGEDGRTFELTYGALNQCGARLRMPLTAVDQNQWKLAREGAWLKPLVGGDRVDLRAVESVEVAVLRKSDRPVRWCQTPVRAVAGEPPRLEDPVLPEGTLIDELGQSTIHEWDGRTESVGQLVDRLREQRRRADEFELPGEVDEWGGWTGREFEATGYFDTHHDGDRWWLVTPAGHPFWSAGLDCVSPTVTAHAGGVEDAAAWLPDVDGEFGDARRDDGDDPTLNYLAANFRRAFGDDWREAWSTVTVGLLRRSGFNTVANWSDWRTASERGVPYVRPLNFEFPGTPTVYRDFPDVFHDDFPEAAATFAEQLEETVGDPAMIGYFLGNEPTWGFAEETPAEGVLYTTESCATREALADWLADRHGAGNLADAWGMPVTLADVASGTWTDPPTEAARADLEDFSSVMVDRLYEVASGACRAVDPDHLNLGTRYAFVPGEWALDGMAHVDVFSINCYQERVPEEYGDIAETVNAPVLVGEWHFGALDVGLPASGIRRVPDQDARGDAYRTYLESAVAEPWCVGTHYFQCYDHSLLGRYDGENYQIGLFDVCNRPYPVASAARESHERLYDLAVGEVEPYDDAPEYCSQLF